MTHAVKHEVSITTDASGDAVVYTDIPVNGRVSIAKYSKTDFADTADFNIATEDTGQTIWNEANVTTSKTIAPRQATHATDGSASLYAGSGEPVEGYIVAANERIKVTIAQGGNAKTGSFTFITF